MNLSDRLILHVRIDLAHQKALKRLAVETVGDILYYLPVKYDSISDVQSIVGLQKSNEVVVYGRLSGLKTKKAWRSKKPIAEGYVEDGSAKVKVLWFNQPYLAKMYQDGAYVKLAGKVAGSEGKLYLSNPEIELIDSLPIDRPDSIFVGTQMSDDTIYPVYRETKDITSRWIHHTVLKLFEKGALKMLTDPIPIDILKKYHLPELQTALVWAHAPKKIKDAEAARKRFAFEEVFYIQIQKALERAAVSAAQAYTINTNLSNLLTFTKRFPFALTAAQQTSIETILADFSSNRPMSRLLEGDVGSGKTAVAATTAYMVVTSRPPEGVKSKSEQDLNSNSNAKKVSLTDVDFGALQVAYMAPTEILAKQHFESFIEYFKYLPIQIGLITSSGCMKFPSKSNSLKPTKISKTQLLKWVRNGEIAILIGTHSLIQKSVEFKHLAYVIIDEQHRFGTNQRKLLAKKDTRLPHLLSMTATPIPRTLALTVYGDLDITLLNQMPAGRKPVVTTIVSSAQQTVMYDHIKNELAAGRQAYIICPRIDEPDPTKENALNMKSVIAETDRLKKDVFPGQQIAALHGKMTPSEKDKIMSEFADNKINILVATSVVEVGVNVPNATNIIIEGAERFGLAQLHQLRGRVIRGNYQPYCFVVTESKSAKTKDRLKALATAKNGFELAEYDLQFRGSGELYGGKQSGLTDLGMEAIRNLKLVEAARTEAYYMVKSHPDLSRDFPLISERVGRLGEMLHLE